MNSIGWYTRFGRGDILKDGGRKAPCGSSASELSIGFGRRPENLRTFDIFPVPLWRKVNENNRDKTAQSLSANFWCACKLRMATGKISIIETGIYDISVAGAIFRPASVLLANKVGCGKRKSRIVLWIWTIDRISYQWSLGQSLIKLQIYLCRMRQ